MSLATFETKAEALVAMLEKKMEGAALTALPITQKLETMLTSETGVIIEGLIPNGAIYAVDAILAINAAIPALKLIAGIGDTSSTKGLLQRLGSTLTGIIHGGKKPFTFYVAAFEFVCFGSSAGVTATVHTP